MAILAALDVCNATYKLQKNIGNQRLGVKTERFGGEVIVDKGIPCLRKLTQ